MRLKPVFRCCVLAGLLVLPFPSAAVGLGRLTLQSGLGQALQAEIELTSIQPGELDTLSARLADQATYARNRIDYAGVLSRVRLSLDQRGGRPVLRLTSSQPINDPFLDLLIEINWANGRIVREYTFLLDPPGYAATTPVEPAAAIPSESLAPPVTQARPAPTPQSPATAPVTGAPAAAGASTTPAPTPAPAPAGRAAAGAATAGAARAGTGEYGPVRRGETLAQIAAKVKPEGVTLEQMLSALYRSNAQAFDGRNMNRLRTGPMLTVPNADEISSTPADEARKEIRVQAADWRAYRERLASSIGTSETGATPARPSSGGRITTAVDEKAAAVSGSDRLKLSKGEPVSGSISGRGGSAAKAENAVAGERAVTEANARVAELERQLKNMQRLLELKNPAMAGQQQAAADPKGAAKGAPGTTATPATPSGAASSGSQTIAPLAAAPAITGTPAGSAASSVKADTAKADPKADAGKDAAAKADAAKAGAAKSDAAKADAARTDAAKTDAAKTDAARADAARTDAAKLDAARADAAKADAAKTDAAKSDSAKADAAKSDASKAPTLAAAETQKASPSSPATPATPSTAPSAGATSPAASTATSGSATATSPARTGADTATAPAPTPTATDGAKSRPGLQPPAPQPEPSFLDDLLANSVFLIGGGAVLLLALLWAVLARRRRDATTKFEDSISASTDLRTSTVFGNTGGGVVNTGDNSLVSDFSREGMGNIDTGEVDPIAEAEVYLAYGRDNQAEEILRDALTKTPDRQEIRLKLLEIYAQQNKAAAFESTASELLNATNGTGEVWNKAAQLGRTIDPDNPLYAPKDGESDPVAPAQPASRPDRMSDSNLRVAEAVEKSAAETGFDFNDDAKREVFVMPPALTPAEAARTAAAASGNASTGSSMEWTHVAASPSSPAQPARQPQSPASRDSQSLGAGSLTAPLAAAASASVAAASARASAVRDRAPLDFKLDSGPEESADPAPASMDFVTLDGPITLTGASTLSGPSTATAVTLASPSSDIWGDKPLPTLTEKDLTAAEGAERPVDLPERDFAHEFTTALSSDTQTPAPRGRTVLTGSGPSLYASSTAASSPPATPSQSQSQFQSPAQTAAPAPRPAAPQFDLDKLDLSFDADPNVTDDGGPAALDGQWHDAATKLDLAKAYHEMGDVDGAREILQEVTQEGDDEQKKEAQAFLAKLRA